jgi:hypothetical protein
MSEGGKLTSVSTIFKKHEDPTGKIGTIESEGDVLLDLQYGRPAGVLDELKTKPQTSVPLITDLRSLTSVEGGACHDKSTVAFEADTTEAKEKRTGNEYR